MIDNDGFEGAQASKSSSADCKVQRKESRKGGQECPVNYIAPCHGRGKQERLSNRRRAGKYPVGTGVGMWEERQLTSLHKNGTKAGSVGSRWAPNRIAQISRLERDSSIGPWWVRISQIPRE